MNDLNELRDEIYSDAVAHGLWDEDYLWRTLRSNDCLRDSGILQIHKIANTERQTRRVNAVLRVFLENEELLESVLEETIENYKPFYVRKAYAKEGIKRSVKQVRAHLLALVDDLDAMEE